MIAPNFLRHGNKLYAPAAREVNRPRATDRIEPGCHNPDVAFSPLGTDIVPFCDIMPGRRPGARLTKMSTRALFAIRVSK
jgi:hypothetical protein